MKSKSTYIVWLCLVALVFIALLWTSNSPDRTHGKRINLDLKPSFHKDSIKIPEFPSITFDTTTKVSQQVLDSCRQIYPDLDFDGICEPGRADYPCCAYNYQ